MIAEKHKIFFSFLFHDKGPNLVDAGNSTGSDQEIFEVEVDAWLNLRTGAVSALNYSQTAEQATVRTFNPKYDGQVAQELTGRADATDSFTVSFNCPPCSELQLRPCFAVQPQQPNERVAICLFVICHSLLAIQFVFIL